MIRAMQLWTMINMVGVRMPVHMNLFLIGSVAVSSMDVLDMESTYEEYLELRPTEALTSKFEFYGIDN